MQSRLLSHAPPPALSWMRRSIESPDVPVMSARTVTVVASVPVSRRTMARPSELVCTSSEVPVAESSTVRSIMLAVVPVVSEKLTASFGSAVPLSLVACAVSVTRVPV
jgi:hypothetical protein